MLKIGIIGAGHLGKIHIKLALQLTNIFDVVGFYDSDEANANEVSNLFKISSFKDPAELIKSCDCIDIVTPTLSHFRYAILAIQNGKHVFIEKPITETIEEAEKLFSEVKNTNLKIQVGHVERFNPAFQAALNYINNPLFIETHRLAQFNPRGTDVPVVLDLMIHDIDIVLSSVRSTVSKISASGVSIVSDTSDIANARIEFENGCVANLTASRISLKNMRKSRFFQSNAYISVDFLSKEMEMVQMENVNGTIGDFDMILELGEGKPKKKIIFEKPSILETNAILEELRSFGQAILLNARPIVNLNDGMDALKVAHQILNQIAQNNQVMLTHNKLA